MKAWLGLAATAVFCTTMLHAQTAAPAAPKPQADAAANPFPPLNEKNFTAATPTRADVNAFLTALWGYDPNRIWQVAAIEKTPAPGVAKVVVFVADRAKQNSGTRAVFFTTPDGHHAISGDVTYFGPKPFAENRALLQAEANGPARGAGSDALELVEFADLQCSACREAQTKMDQLATDFPQAKIVFENFPMIAEHPYALAAAEYGVCVRKDKGDAAFFTYAAAVFHTQAALTEGSYKSTLASAVTTAGANPATVATCVALPETRATVMAQRSLGERLGVAQTPTLAINGHLVPLSEVPYETLKAMVAFQATQDGVQVHVQPTLSTLQ